MLPSNGLKVTFTSNRCQIHYMSGVLATKSGLRFWIWSPIFWHAKLKVALFKFRTSDAKNGDDVLLPTIPKRDGFDGRYNYTFLFKIGMSISKLSQCLLLL